jgi:hypothetical protein
VALYFTMLDKATAGDAYNKASMIRTAQGSGLNSNGSAMLPPGPLAARSKQSIEFKLMNCSACHQALDPNAETMHGHGYRALTSFQASLLDTMRTELGNRGNVQWSHRAASAS